MPSFHREPGEVAEAKPAIFPFNAGEVLLIEVFCFHLVFGLRVDGMLLDGKRIELSSSG